MAWLPEKKRDNSEFAILLSYTKRPYLANKLAVAILKDTAVYG